MSVANRSGIGQARPWHREPWPWFIIGLIGSAVIASLITLWIALRNPDVRVVDDTRYDQLRSEMRAQAAEENEPEAGKK